MILLAPLVLWGQDTVKQILYDLLHALYQPMSESRFGGHHQKWFETSDLPSKSK